VLDQAAALKMSAMAVTEHGNMFSSVIFHDHARKRGIKPILGCEVYVATMLSRSGSGTNSQTNDANKNSLDVQIAANWKNAGFDGFVDFASNPNLGANNAYSNTTYFQADGIHPNQTGANLMGSIASNVLNYYHSVYSEGSPHTVSTTPYTMTVQDVALNFMTGASAVSMISCQGFTGREFLFTNISGGNVTLTTNGSELINGASTSVISDGTSVRLKAAVLDYSTSGCRWTK